MSDDEHENPPETLDETIEHVDAEDADSSSSPTKAASPASNTTTAGGVPPPQLENTAVLEPEEILPDPKPFDGTFHSPFPHHYGGAVKVSADMSNLPAWMKSLLTDDFFYFDRLVFPQPPKPKAQKDGGASRPVADTPSVLEDGEGGDGEDGGAAAAAAAEGLDGEAEGDAAVEVVKTIPPQINVRDLYALVKWSDNTYTLTSAAAAEAAVQANAEPVAHQPVAAKTSTATAQSGDGGGEEGSGEGGSAEEVGADSPTEAAAPPSAAAAAAAPAASSSAPGSKVTTPRVPAAAAGEAAAAPAAAAAAAAPPPSKRVPVLVLEVDVLVLATLQCPDALARLLSGIPMSSFCLDQLASFVASIDIESSAVVATAFSSAKAAAANGNDPAKQKMYFDVQPFFDALHANPLRYAAIERALVAFLRVGGVPRLSGPAPPVPPPRSATADGDAEGAGSGDAPAEAEDDAAAAPPVTVALTDRLGIRTPSAAALFLAMLFHLPRSVLLQWMLPAPPATADEEPEALEDEVKRTKPVAFALGQTLLELRRRAARFANGKSLMRQPLEKALQVFLQDTKRKFPIESGSDLDPLVTDAFEIGQSSSTSSSSISSSVLRSLYQSDLVLLLLALAPHYSRYARSTPLHAGTDEQEAFQEAQLAEATWPLGTFQKLWSDKLALPKRSQQQDNTAMFALLLQNLHLMTAKMGRALLMSTPLWAHEGRGVFGLGGVAPWPTLVALYATPHLTYAQRCGVMDAAQQEEVEMELNRRAKVFVENRLASVLALRFWRELLAAAPPPPSAASDGAEEDDDVKDNFHILKLLAREATAAAAVASGGSKKPASSSSDLSLAGSLRNAQGQFGQLVAAFSAVPPSPIWAQQEGDAPPSSAAAATSAATAEKSSQQHAVVAAADTHNAAAPSMPHGNARWALTPIARLLTEKLPPWSAVSSRCGDDDDDVPTTIAAETALTPALLSHAVQSKNWDAVAFLVTIHRITHVAAARPSSAAQPNSDEQAVHVLEDALLREDAELVAVLARVGMSLRHRIDGGLRSGLTAVQDKLLDINVSKEVLNAWRCVEQRRVADPESLHGLRLHVRD